MRIRTKDLKAGTVMCSGELVIAAVANRGKSTMHNGHSMVATLQSPRTGKVRVSDFAYSGTLFVKSIPE